MNLHLPLNLHLPVIEHKDTFIWLKIINLNTTKCHALKMQFGVFGNRS